MANIYICCDGTWQSEDREQDGVPILSNVRKLFNAVDTADSNGDKQKSYYHPGVGTEGGPLKQALGGGTGLGLRDNVKSAYKWLATKYDPGDRIYLFGYSRGAYTVRSLCGMIAACGLIDLRGFDVDHDKLWERVDTLFNKYRRKNFKKKLLADSDFHHTQQGEDPAGKTPIHFLGVWDTVGALGIPDHLGILNILDRPNIYAFHDTELSSIVKHARHAIAIDEMRESFTPTLWSKIHDGTDAKEMWFAGVHGDIGGGYSEPDSGLANTALKWMIDESAASGLQFKTTMVDRIDDNAHGTRHDSVSGVFKALRTRPRNVPGIHDENNVSLFHSSVFARRNDPPITDPEYFPSRSLAVGEKDAWTVFARPHWNSTGLHVKSGERYAITAHGQWLDGTIETGARGTRDGHFQFGEIFQLFSSGVGQVERLFKAVSGNDQADFWYTKREEKFPWFALIGVISNGQGTDNDGNPNQHQTFLIGESVTLDPTADGYLYCFANDAWHTYHNNKGSVTMTIERII